MGYSPQQTRRKAFAQTRVRNNKGYQHAPKGPTTTGDANAAAAWYGAASQGGGPANPYADIASQNMGNLGTTNAPGVAGGGVPAVAAPSPITAEYTANKAAIDQAYADNAAKLQALQAQYQTNAGAIAGQSQGDYQGARNITGAEDRGVNRDLAAQGAGGAGNPVAAQQRLEQSTLADAHLNQQNLLNQNNQLQVADFGQRAAAGNAAQASSQSALLQAYQAAQAQAAADAASGGGGGGGGGGHGGGGSSAAADGGLTSSQYYLARNIANDRYGAGNLRHDFLAGQSYSKRQKYLAAALHDLRHGANPQSLLHSTKKKHADTRQLIMDYIKATSKQGHAGPHQIQSTLAQLFG